MDGVRGVDRRDVPRLMRSVEEHRRVVADLITRRPPETVALADALGLVLADDVIAPLSLPGFDNSAMDGYAVVADDIAGASAEQPVLLPVAEDIPAGRTDPLTLKPGTAHRIMTGAPLPYGCDRRCPRRSTPTPRPTPSRSAPPHRVASTSAARARTSRRAPRCCGPASSSRLRRSALAAALGFGRADGISPAAGAGDVDRL